MVIKRCSLFEGAKECSGVVVAVDVLRAFTTAYTLFEAGAENVFLADDIKFLLSEKKRDRNLVLVGERNAYRLKYFDFGNDPSDVLKSDLKGKTVFMSTSAGVRGISILNADRVFLGSFVCFSALGRLLKRFEGEVVSILALGRGGLFKALEDEIFSKVLAEFLIGKRGVPLSAELLEISVRGGLIEKFKNPDFSKRFRLKDLQIAFDVDRYDFVLEAIRQEETPRIFRLEKVK